MPGCNTRFEHLALSPIRCRPGKQAGRCRRMQHIPAPTRQLMLHLPGSQLRRPIMHAGGQQAVRAACGQVAGRRQFEGSAAGVLVKTSSCNTGRSHTSPAQPALAGAESQKSQHGNNCRAHRQHHTLSVKTGTAHSTSGRLIPRHQKPAGVSRCIAPAENWLACKSCDRAHDCADRHG